MKEGKFSGLAKIIKIWYGDCDADYQWELFNACEKKINEKIDYYTNKGIGEGLAMRGAYALVNRELSKYANIR